MEELVLRQDENSVSENLLEPSQLAGSPSSQTCWQKQIYSLEHNLTPSLFPSL